MLSIFFSLLAMFCAIANTESRSDDGLIPDPPSSITTVFYSRRDIRAARLSVHLNSPNASRQYIFTNPQSPFWQAGPSIYDQDGELIWAGAADGITANAYGFHACDYRGEIGNHLCLFQGVQMFGRGHGYGLILNNKYKIVHVVQFQGGSDIHEFRTVEGGRSALVTFYATRPYDFTDMGNPQGLTEIDDSGFAEIDLQTGLTVFEWHSLDHVKPQGDARRVEIDSGQAPVLDYFHINSVDKDIHGDYLISARHTSAAYKVSGVDGSIIWSLSNGPESTFTIHDFILWGAHHARWVAENETHTILSLFNNGHDGQSARLERSSGVILVLDHKTSNAYHIAKYGDGLDLLAESKGSLQTLPNSNVLLAWGSQPHIAEFQEDGNMAFHASVVGGGDIYRVFKQDWVGIPSGSPDLWIYASTEQSSVVFYVSWNGATEVKSWRFYGGNNASHVPGFTLLGSATKFRFETNFTASTYFNWGFAEAIAANGTSLGNSSAVPPWIPSADLATGCNTLACPDRSYKFLVLYNLLPDLHGLQRTLKESFTVQIRQEPFSGKLFIIMGVFGSLLSVFIWLYINTDF